MRVIAIFLSLAIIICASMPACARDLEIRGSLDHPVVLIPFDAKTEVSSLEPWLISKKTIIYTGNAETLEVQPYNIDSTALKDEIVAFRHQYAILWIVLMGISFYLFINRNA